MATPWRPHEGHQIIGFLMGKRSLRFRFKRILYVIARERKTRTRRRERKEEKEKKRKIRIYREEENERRDK